MEKLLVPSLNDWDYTNWTNAADVMVGLWCTWSIDLFCTFICCQFHFLWIRYSLARCCRKLPSLWKQVNGVNLASSLNEAWIEQGRVAGLQSKEVFLSSKYLVLWRDLGTGSNYLKVWFNFELTRFNGILHLATVAICWRINSDFFGLSVSRASATLLRQVWVRYH